MKEKYNVKDSAIVLLFTIAMPLLVSMFLSVLFLAISKWSGISTSKITSNIFVYLGLLFVTQATFLAVFIAYNKKEKKNFKVATGINKKLSWLQVLIICLLTVGALFLFLPLINVFDAFIRKIGFNQSGDLPFAINNFGMLIVGLVFLALLPAICEESVFRGIIFKGLLQKNKVLAVILSAVCFSLMHMSLQQTIYPLLLGTTFALIVLITGNLKGSVIAHFVNNSIVVISQYISSFSSSTTETAISLNAKTIISAIVCAVIGGLFIWGMCVLLKLATKKKEKKEQDKLQITQETAVSENLTVSETTTEKAKKEDLRLFFIYMLISLVVWVVSNASYFGG